MLFDISSIVYLGFHPSARARFALHREFVPRDSSYNVSGQTRQHPETWTHRTILGHCVIRLVKRRRRPFVGGTHTQRDEGLADPFRSRSEHVFAVPAKLQAVPAVTCTAI